MVVILGFSRNFCYWFLVVVIEVLHLHSVFYFRAFVYVMDGVWGGLIGGLLGECEVGCAWRKTCRCYSVYMCV